MYVVHSLTGTGRVFRKRYLSWGLLYPFPPSVSTSLIVLQVVGCVLLNVMGAGLDVARRLIDEGRPVKEWKELSKLFQLYSVTAEEKREGGESAEKTDKK